jgi:N-acetylneuraminic acid mutarotase
MATAVWTGTEMVVWGGHAGMTGTGNNDGGRYNAAEDQWRSVSLEGAPSPRSGHTAVWTGTEMIVWGGSSHSPLATGERTATGGRYDPTTDTWTPLSEEGAPEPRSGHSAVWTGSAMLIFGGADSDVQYADVWMYVP